jgi:dimethylaniline monooxygenase (N-oxide forming)
MDTRGRAIDLAPWPEHIDDDGVVHFTNNGRPEWERMKDEKIKPDIVVFCTGYRQEFPFFNQVNFDEPESSRPYLTASDADVRNIWASGDPTVGFIGFVRPSLGAIPPLAEFQAQLWILKLVAPERIPRPLLPRDEPHYRLHHPKGSRIHYGVDHESYAYQLALDMGSAPGILEILGRARDMTVRGKQGWKLPVTWALGANYNTKFRLRGPWAIPDGDAEDMMVTEVWTTILRRRLFFGRLSIPLVLL